MLELDRPRTAPDIHNCSESDRSTRIDEYSTGNLSHCNSIYINEGRVQILLVSMDVPDVKTTSPIMPPPTVRMTGLYKSRWSTA